MDTLLSPCLARVVSASSRGSVVFSRSVGRFFWVVSCGFHRSSPFSRSGVFLSFVGFSSKCASGLNSFRLCLVEDFRGAEVPASLINHTFSVHSSWVVRSGRPRLAVSGRGHSDGPDAPLIRWIFQSEEMRSGRLSLAVSGRGNSDEPDAFSEHRDGCPYSADAERWLNVSVSGGEAQKVQSHSRKKRCHKLRRMRSTGQVTSCHSRPVRLERFRRIREHRDWWDSPRRCGAVGQVLLTQAGETWNVLAHFPNVQMGAQSQVIVATASSRPTSLLALSCFPPPRLRRDVLHQLYSRGDCERAQVGNLFCVGDAECVASDSLPAQATPSPKGDATHSVRRHSSSPFGASQKWVSSRSSHHPAV